MEYFLLALAAFITLLYISEFTENKSSDELNADQKYALALINRKERLIFSAVLIAAFIFLIFAIPTANDELIIPFAGLSYAAYMLISLFICFKLKRQNLPNYFLAILIVTINLRFIAFVCLYIGQMYLRDVNFSLFD